MQGEYLELFPSAENLHYISLSHVSEKEQNHRTFHELCQACSGVHLITLWGTLQ